MKTAVPAGWRGWGGGEKNVLGFVSFIELHYPAFWELRILDEA